MKRDIFVYAALFFFAISVVLASALVDVREQRDHLAAECSAKNAAMRELVSTVETVTVIETVVETVTVPIVETVTVPIVETVYIETESSFSDVLTRWELAPITLDELQAMEIEGIGFGSLYVTP